MDKDKKKKTEKSLQKAKEPKKSTSKAKEPDSPKSKGKSPKNKEPVLDRSASEISLVAPPLPESLCHLHRGTFVFYCETCEEAVCNQCITFGPHNNQYHRIIKMGDAYKQRAFSMSECFRLNLVGKREQLIQHLQRYQRQIEEVKNYKHSIERETRAEYGSFLEKLRLAEGSKAALILYEISTLQKEINGINDLGTKFYEMTNAVNIPAGEQPQKYIRRFLAKSKQMYEAVEYYLNKPVRPNLDIDVTDLPNQLQNQRQQASLVSCTGLVNQFRDECIWRLTNRDGQIKRNIEAKADSLIRNLSEEADFLNNRLKDYNLVCTFCGQFMNDTNVNNECSCNASEVAEVVASGTSELIGTKAMNEVAPPTRAQTRRHFFTTPSPEQLKKSILL